MIDKRGLQRFTKAVDCLAQDSDEVRSVIGNALADEGRNFANDEFHKYIFDPKNLEMIWQTPYASDYTINVGSREVENGKFEVNAVGFAVMFAEFGTGIRGQQGNYQGQLYDGNLTFISHGQILSTEGYQYNYYKRFYNPKALDWDGYTPVAGLWKAGNYLRQHYAEIAKEALKGTRYGVYKK